MLMQKEGKDGVDVSTRSIKNMVAELRAIKNIIGTMDDVEDIKSFVEEAIQEVVYNVGLLTDGVDYQSDEYSYIFESLRECE